MTDKPVRWSRCLAALAVVGALTTPHLGSAHPLGNFSISHYTAIRLESDAVVLRYIIDMAEIPTFQEIQDDADRAAGRTSEPAGLSRATGRWPALRFDPGAQRSASTPQF